MRYLLIGYGNKRVVCIQWRWKYFMYKVSEDISVVSAGEMLVTKDIDLKALDLNSADRKAYFAVKRFFDIFISLIGLIFVVPVAVVVKLCYVISGDMKPVLYKQKRIGKNGKPIYIYKFRSMVSNADKVLEELLEKEEYKKNGSKIRSLRMTQELQVLVMY